MRVIHVITRLVIGGAQENTIATVLGLHGKSDLEMTLLAGPTRGPEGSLESSFDQRPQLLTIVPSLVRQVAPLPDALTLTRLTKIFRATRPQIVHTHSAKAGILGRLAAHRAGVPIIIHTIHGPSFGPFQGPAANLLFCAAERFAGRFTTHFVSVAQAMSRQYLAAGIGQPSQYSRIFSGFALEPFLAAGSDAQMRARLHVAPDDFVLGKISRLFKLKGHDDLLAAAPALVRQCPRFKFLLVGDGALRATLENRVRALGLEKHFLFTGLVPPLDIPRYLAVMDALVHLSRREGLARALPQALAAGRPVVAYDCDGAAEVCFDNDTGFLIRPGDIQTLQRRLLQLAADKTLRERMGRRGREFVRQHFSLQTMLATLHALYLKLASQKGL
jgi:glycosyltransferase involved in cell wall biosynthesis